MGSHSTYVDRRREEGLRSRERTIAQANEARMLFSKVRLSAQLRRLWGIISGGSIELPSGHDLLRGAIPLTPRPSGVEHIDLARVVGSEGRSRDFDRAFAPTRSYTRERWQRIAIAWMDGTPLDPVRLIQLGDRYLVRDGHHRISVARSFGAVMIEAVVEQRFALPETVRAGALVSA